MSTNIKSLPLEPPEPVDVASGVSLVRTALASHLDVFREAASGRTGRNVLAERMGVQPSGITDRLRGLPKQLVGLVRDAERFRLLNTTSVSDLAQRVGVDETDPWSERIGPRLWPDLRAANGLEPQAMPRFRAPVDVTLASAALIARYPHLMERNADGRRQLDGGDLEAARELASALCKVCSGPYGVGSAGITQLAVLAPLTIDVVVDYLKSGPVGSGVVRALDRALRLDLGDAQFRQTLQTLIANPPGLLFRNALWMRAVRRVMWFDRSHGERTVKRWAMDQARRAVDAEDAYSWSGYVEQRYALWVFAEFSDPGSEPAGSTIRALAARFGPHLVADVESARAYLRATSRSRQDQDLFNFSPPDGWTAPTSIEEVLRSTLRPISPVTSSLGEAKRLRPQTRLAGMALAREALLAPCAIRHRTAIDALQACAPILQTEVSLAVADLVRQIALSEKTIDPATVTVIERCVHLLGALYADVAIDVLSDLVRARHLPVEVVKVAILAAGYVGQMRPNDSVGLIAWACAAANRVNTDPCVAAAIHASVSTGVDPLRYLDPQVASAGGAPAPCRDTARAGYRCRSRA